MDSLIGSRDRSRGRSERTRARTSARTSTADGPSSGWDQWSGDVDTLSDGGDSEFNTESDNPTTSADPSVTGKGASAGSTGNVDVGDVLGASKWGAYAVGMATENPAAFEIGRNLGVAGNVYSAATEAYDAAQKGEYLDAAYEVAKGAATYASPAVGAVWSAAEWAWGSWKGGLLGDAANSRTNEGLRDYMEDAHDMSYAGSDRYTRGGAVEGYEPGEWGEGPRSDVETAISDMESMLADDPARQGFGSGGDNDDSGQGDDGSGGSSATSGSMGDTASTA